MKTCFFTSLTIITLSVLPVFPLYTMQLQRKSLGNKKTKSIWRGPFNRNQRRDPTPVQPAIIPPKPSIRTVTFLHPLAAFSVSIKTLEEEIVKARQKIAEDTLRGTVFDVIRKNDIGTPVYKILGKLKKNIDETIDVNTRDEPTQKFYTDITVLQKTLEVDLHLNKKKIDSDMNNLHLTLTQDVQDALQQPLYHCYTKNITDQKLRKQVSKQLQESVQLSDLHNTEKSDAPFEDLTKSVLLANAALLNIENNIAPNHQVPTYGNCMNSFCKDIFGIQTLSPAEKNLMLQIIRFTILKKIQTPSDTTSNSKDLVQLGNTLRSNICEPLFFTDKNNELKLAGVDPNLINTLSKNSGLICVFFRYKDYSIVKHVQEMLKAMAKKVKESTSDFQNASSFKNTSFSQTSFLDLSKAGRFNNFNRISSSSSSEEDETKDEYFTLDGSFSTADSTTQSNESSPDNSLTLKIISPQSSPEDIAKSLLRHTQTFPDGWQSSKKNSSLSFMYRIDQQDRAAVIIERVTNGEFTSVNFLNPNNNSENSGSPFNTDDDFLTNKASTVIDIMNTLQKENAKKKFATRSEKQQTRFTTETTTTTQSTTTLNTDEKDSLENENEKFAAGTGLQEEIEWKEADLAKPQAERFSLSLTTEQHRTTSQQEICDAPPKILEKIVTTELTPLNLTSGSTTPEENATNVKENNHPQETNLPKTPPSSVLPPKLSSTIEKDSIIPQVTSPKESTSVLSRLFKIIASPFSMLWTGTKNIFAWCLSFVN